MLAPQANACPPNEVDTTYYADASLTVECWYRIISCNCQVYSEGCHTAYSTTDTYPASKNDIGGWFSLTTRHNTGCIPVFGVVAELELVIPTLFPFPLKVHC